MNTIAGLLARGHQRLAWPLAVAVAAFLGMTALAAGDVQAAAGSAVPLPGNSLYALHLTLERADGTHFQLGQLRGKPVLVTMFYTQCTNVCPMLVAQLRKLAESLDPAERSRLAILMVSLDPGRDTPGALAEYARQQRLGADDWILARGSARDTRLLATALDVRYRQAPDGSVNHAATIVLLDADGVPRARSSEILLADAAFQRAIRGVVAAGPDAPVHAGSVVESAADARHD